MRSRIVYFLVCVLALNTGGANANWQYSGEYTYSTSPSDSGGRATITIRGGMSYLMASMQNDAKSVEPEFCINPDTGVAFPLGGASDCSAYEGFVSAGSGKISDLGMEKLSDIAFSAGASIGWVLPNNPRWRLELGWDHFTEVDYNESPVFRGNITFSGGDTAYVKIGTVQSTVSSDIISVMAYYDFFEGTAKPMGKMIPYFGLGFGYADTKTVMNLSDSYGDFTSVEDLTNFGEPDGNGVIQFYRSTTNTANVAAVGALGFAYGLNENLFLDFGARVSYIPRVKYRLVNSDETRHLDWFSAKNLIYANVMLGLRFEF